MSEGGALSARSYLDISPSKSTPTPALRGSAFDLYRNCELPEVESASQVGFDASPGCNLPLGISVTTFLSWFSTISLRTIRTSWSLLLRGRGYPPNPHLGCPSQFRGSHLSPPNFRLNYSAGLPTAMRRQTLAGFVNPLCSKDIHFHLSMTFTVPVMHDAFSSSCPRRRLDVMSGDMKHGAIGQPTGHWRIRAGAFRREVGEIAYDVSCATSCLNYEWYFWL